VHGRPPPLRERGGPPGLEMPVIPMVWPLPLGALGARAWCTRSASCRLLLLAPCRIVPWPHTQEPPPSDDGTVEAPLWLPPVPQPPLLPPSPLLPPPPGSLPPRCEPLPAAGRAPIGSLAACAIAVTVAAKVSGVRDSSRVAGRLDSEARRRPRRRAPAPGCVMSVDPRLSETSIEWRFSPCEALRHGRTSAAPGKTEWVGFRVCRQVFGCRSVWIHMRQGSGGAAALQFVIPAAAGQATQLAQALGRLQTVEHAVCCSSFTAELHGPGVGDPPSTTCAAAAAAPGGHVSPCPPSSDDFQQRSPAQPSPTLCGTGRAGPVSPVARPVSSVPKSSEGLRIREVTCRRPADQGLECQRNTYV